MLGHSLFFSLNSDRLRASWLICHPDSKNIYLELNSVEILHVDDEWFQACALSPNMPSRYFNFNLMMYTYMVRMKCKSTTQMYILQIHILCCFPPCAHDSKCVYLQCKVVLGPSFSYYCKLKLLLMLLYRNLCCFHTTSL